MGMTGSYLSQHLTFVQTEKPAVLLHNVAVANFALPLRTQETRIGQNESTKGRGALAGDDGRGHASHRVPEQYWSGQSKPPDESNDVARVILVPIPEDRSAINASTSVSPPRKQAQVR
jgi:hypothetical protein